MPNHRSFFTSSALHVSETNGNIVQEKDPPRVRGSQLIPDRYRCFCWLQILEQFFDNISFKDTCINIMLYSAALLISFIGCAQAFQINSRISKSTTLSMVAGKLLIVQNKGGGHGTVGYQLCKVLKAENPNLDIMMLQDKCNKKKEPFNAYDELTALGVTIIEENLGEVTSADALPEAIKSVRIDYIVDNFSKGPANAQVFLDIAKTAGSQQYVFISSGGMYKGGGVAPLLETDEVKDSNGARTVEQAIVASYVPYTFIRPQYIYGPKSSKRYLDFFIGRAARKLPIPLPLSGQQLVSLSHIEDVCTLIGATVGNAAAKNEVFNCGSDEFVTYQGLCGLIHNSLDTEDKDRKYLYYEPKDYNFDGSAIQEFPFRRETFIVSSNKAILKLGWKPKHSIVNYIKEDIDTYIASGGLKEQWTKEEELKYDAEIVSKKPANA